MKYNALRVNWADKIFVFVSKGEEVVTYEEALNYLKQVPIETNGVDIEGVDVDKAIEPREPWSIPDNKQRKNMFRNDLRRGVKFSAQKYGVSEEQIMAESERIFPSYRVRSLHAEKAK